MNRRKVREAQARAFIVVIIYFASDEGGGRGVLFQCLFVLRVGGRLRHGCQFLLILGVHLLRSASRRFYRHSPPRRKFREVLICSGQMMRHPALGTRDQLAWDAVVRREVHVLIQDPVVTANEWLREIYRIVHDASHDEVLMVAHVVFRHDRFIAAREAILPEVALFEVGHGHLEHVRYPFPGGKTLPHVRCVLGWMRPAIHVNDALGGVVLHYGVPSGDGQGERIGVRIDAQVGGAVVRRVLFALMLDHVGHLCVPRVCPQAICIIDRYSSVVTDLGTGCSFRLIFLLQHGPLAGQIQLSRRALSHRTQKKEQEDGQDGASRRGLETGWSGSHCTSRNASHYCARLTLNPGK